LKWMKSSLQRLIIKVKIIISVQKVARRFSSRNHASTGDG
jgi:hypothetical protein